MEKYSGQCSCGAVTFVASGKPIFSQHCHCHGCREIASMSQKPQDRVGYSYTAAYAKDNFEITAGDLESIMREKSIALICPSCKSYIYGISSDPTKQEGIGVNANNFDFHNGIPDSFKPVRHVYYDFRLQDFPDDLPKLADMMTEHGGSGKLSTNKIL